MNYQVESTPAFPQLMYYFLTGEVSGDKLYDKQLVKGCRKYIKNYMQNVEKSQWKTFKKTVSLGVCCRLDHKFKKTTIDASETRLGEKMELFHILTTDSIVSNAEALDTLFWILRRDKHDTTDIYAVATFVAYSYSH